MKKRFQVLLITIMMIVFTGAGVTVAAAFSTPEYDVEVQVSKNAVFEYKETITVDFDSPSHGIYRNIPLDSEYKIDSIRVDGFDYKVSESNGYKIIRIGSADFTVEGIVKYPIYYTIRGYEDDETGYDALYLDLIPTGWQSDIDHAHVVVHVPEDMPLDRINCFVGMYGDGTYGMESEYGTWTVDEAAHTITFDGHDLPEGFGATVDVGLPDGYWKGAMSFRWMRYLAYLIAAAGMLVIAGMRFTVGRNPQVVKPVEFYPPEDMTPLDVGYVIDGRVDPDDMTSTFFYLADKGYMDIEETSKNNFKFTRLALPTQEKGSIQRFYKGIFGTHAFDELGSDDTKYKTANSARIGSRMATAYAELPGKVKKEFSEAGKDLYTKGSKRANTLSKFIFFLVLFGFGLLDSLYVGDIADDGIAPIIGNLFITYIMLRLLNWFCKTYDYLHSRKAYKSAWRIILWSLLYLLVASAYTALFTEFRRDHVSYDPVAGGLMIAFIFLMPFLIIGMKSRSRENSDLLGRVLGFKNFIQAAELPKLNELVEQDPNYFYNILPYAYVFGLTDKWAKKFENIAIPEPQWYHPYVTTGHVHTFHPNTMSTAMHSVSSSITSHMITSDSGSSRSYSGGGGGGWSGGGRSSGGGG
ncbi:MAG: DUF2207 domain-containing protein, partial [Mogibacterium sp.]|nr:DUF2207 domain-containing protein [Mogibacterium sp.]